MAVSASSPSLGAAIVVAFSVLSAVAFTACGQGMSAARPFGAPAPADPDGPSVTITTSPAPGRTASNRRGCLAYCRSRLDGAPPFKVVNASTDAGCCDLCSADAMCNAWVRDNRTSLCALRSETFDPVLDPVANENFVAGLPEAVLDPAEADLEDCPPLGETCVACSTIEFAVDSPVDDDGGGPRRFPCSSSRGVVFTGRPINGGGQRTGSAQACCDLCQRRDGTCYLWSWRRSDRRCFLRTFGGRARDGNFVSGSLF
ncbi:unnamed protein product [Ostreobium quekettii]|uniref:Apple domain-containing protein n=1 Tax=Ostreobium quekettii TaxID=121088 RepID=A0A8S1ISP5_9CHLO|nr:unnamed protein product [Ostreobium quekettii]